MEKFSSFERVVGNASEEIKEKLLCVKAERFKDQAFEDLRGQEREKTPEELQIISLVNEEINKIRLKYGLEKFDIPSKNIHIIRKELWLKEKSSGFFQPGQQRCLIPEKLSNLGFMKTTFHEMLHFSSYNAMQVTVGDGHEINMYRSGLIVYSRDGKKERFSNLNEAVTEEMSKRFLMKFLHHPLFINEVKQTTDVKTKNPHTRTGSGKPLFNDDTFYAEVLDQKSLKESIDRAFGRRIFGSGIKKISTESFTYQSERKVLNTLIDKIFQRNGSVFKNRESVFEVFAKGMMTGNILPMGRLIETTFGTGTLRKIGNLDADADAQQKFVDSL